VDTVSMSLRHLRDSGLILRSEEWSAELESSLRFDGNNNLDPLYPV